MKREADGPRAADPSQTAITSLALELKVPVERVERVYRREAQAIGSDVRVKSYLPVLIARRVRSELRRQQRHS